MQADIEWLPFFLNAGLPEKGTNKLEHYNKKFGGVCAGGLQLRAKCELTLELPTASRVRSMIPHMQETGKKEGIDFSVRCSCSL